MHAYSSLPSTPFPHPVPAPTPSPQATGESSWEPPPREPAGSQKAAASSAAAPAAAEPAGADDPEAGLPPGWRVQYDAEGDPFYTNTVTGESSWYKPT